MNLDGKNVRLNSILTKNILKQIIKFMKVQGITEIQLKRICPYQLNIKSQMSHKI
jgi:hypothetical protein